MDRTSIVSVALAFVLSALFRFSGGCVGVVAGEAQALPHGEDRLYRQMTVSELAWLMTFSPDSSKLAAIVGGDDLTGDVVIWDLKTLSSWTLPREKRGGNYADYYSCPTFMPDGHSLVTARGVYNADPTTFEVDVWSGESFDTRRQIGKFSGKPVALAISPNGKSVAAAGWEAREVVRVPVWRVVDGVQEAVLTADGRQVFDLRFSNNGRNLAAIVSHRSDHGVQVWDVATRQPISRRQFPFPGLMELRGADVSPPFRVVGWHVSERGNDRASTLDATTGIELLKQKLPDNSSTFRFDEPCRRLAVGLRSGTIEVYDVATGRRLHQFTRPLDRAVSFIAFSHDGNWLSASSFLSRVAVWDLSDKPGR